MVQNTTPGPARGEKKEKFLRLLAAQAWRHLMARGDAVHPGPPGQSVMAWGTLKGLHFPRMVSVVDIDVKGTAPARTTNCEVGKITIVDKSEGLIVSFDREDHALPFFPAEAKSILQRAPVLEDLNEYRLKISGLPSGRYEVRLGGKKVAEYPAEELAKGINLAGPALATGPVADQVNAVWKAVQEKNRYFHDRVFRGVVLANAQVPDWLDSKLTHAKIESRRQAAFAKRMERMPELDEAVRQALRPRAHRVEVMRVGS